MLRPRQAVLNRQGKWLTASVSSVDLLTQKIIVDVGSTILDALASRQLQVLHRKAAIVGCLRLSTDKVRQPIEIALLKCRRMVVGSHAKRYDPS